MDEPFFMEGKHMLVMKQKTKDRINFSIDGKRIGQVVVNRVRGKEVSLGFEFVPDVKILRDDVCEQDGKTEGGRCEQ